MRDQRKLATVGSSSFPGAGISRARRSDRAFRCVLSEPPGVPPCHGACADAVQDCADPDGVHGQMENVLAGSWFKLFEDKKREQGRGEASRPEPSQEDPGDRFRVGCSESKFLDSRIETLDSSQNIRGICPM